jgi:hypothetical protein
MVLKKEKHLEMIKTSSMFLPGSIRELQKRPYFIKKN